MTGYLPFLNAHLNSFLPLPPSRAISGLLYHYPFSCACLKPRRALEVAFVVIPRFYFNISNLLSSSPGRLSSHNLLKNV